LQTGISEIRTTIENIKNSPSIHENDNFVNVMEVLISIPFKYKHFFFFEK